MTKPELDGEKKKAKTALDGVKRDTFFRIKYNDPVCKIVVIENPEHPEYDGRITLPVDPARVWSLRENGQINTATGYKLEELDEQGRFQVVLTTGRQRWRAMQKMWEEDLAAGKDEQDLMTFKITLHSKGSSRDRMEISIAENEHRVQDEPIERARKVRKYLDLVGEDEMTRERACKVFNIPSKEMLANLLKLLDLTPVAQAAVSSGTITPTLGTHLSRLPAEEQERVIEKFQEAPSRPSVKEGKEIIREVSGSAPKFEMVNLRLVEKRLEKVATDLDKAHTRLEDCTDGTKVGDLAARIAKLQGWDEALRWARGETTASGGQTQGNDPMSAAWLALTEALVNASWPVILGHRHAEYPTWEPDRRSEKGYEDEYRRAQIEAKQRQDDSLVLFVAGEHVARRRIDASGVTTSLEINTASKWFVRLMDPHGSANKLIREWGAHGWITSRGKANGIPSYKSPWSQYKRDWVAITIDPKKVAEIVKGTPIGNPYSVEHLVLELVKDNVPKAQAVTKESRFGSPWEGGEGEEGTIGPDLEEDDPARECIADELWSTFEIDAPKEDRTWQTVGELIAYVERKVAEASMIHLAAGETIGTDTQGDDYQGDQAGQDGEA